jgi:PAS domain S-box-containing protein
VCSIQRGEQREPKSFRLRLRSPADVTLISSPPWLTAQRVLWVLGGLGGVLVIAVAWVIGLRRLVARQTSKLRKQIAERKRAEEAVRHSAQQIKLMLECVGEGIFGLDMEGRHTFVNPMAARLLGYEAEKLIGQPSHSLWHHTRKDGTPYPPIECPIYNTFREGESHRGEERFWRKDGSFFTAEFNSVPIREKEKTVGAVVIFSDITERKRTEQMLKASEERYRRLFEDALDGFCLVEEQSGMILDCNPALLKLVGREKHEVVGQTQRILHPPSEAIGETTRSFERHRQEKAGQTIEVPILTKAGEVRTAEIRAIVSEVQGRKTMVGIFRDITERKRAQAELENVHQQLLEASRRAGMAEIATSVLHNVGNVLNSVNVSTSLVVASVKKSRTSSLARVVALLQEHAQDLGEFITHNSRGKHLPAHLAQLSEHLLAEQKTNARELDSLRRNVDHIKEIVAMQQNYATFGGVKEMVNVANLVEDSLRMNAGALSRHEVEVIREFETVPLLNVEKHKILQILVNLLRNAKYACDDSERADKRLTVRVVNGDGRIKVSVIDNGVGIPPENLTRIFNHGFTTRKDGHGFGLHSSALAAKEMGGSLTVRSDGVGQGAAFTLELPCPARENSDE